MGVGMHITEVLLITIGLAYITNWLEESIGFNKAHSPVLTDGISHTYKPCSLRQEVEGISVVLFPKA